MGGWGQVDCGIPPPGPHFPLPGGSSTQHTHRNLLAKSVGRAVQGLSVVSNTTVVVVDVVVSKLKTARTRGRPGVWGAPG